MVGKMRFGSGFHSGNESIELIDRDPSHHQTHIIYIHHSSHAFRAVCLSHQITHPHPTNTQANTAHMTGSESSR